jgi:uncharacterized damage-inducible protein DinB
MEITSVSSFLSYYERIRQRTAKLVAILPPDKMDWSYKAGKFTIGDMIRHIAAIERFMFAECVSRRPSRYKGCGPEYGATYGDVVQFFNSMHEESIQIFKSLSDHNLNSICKTPAGEDIKIWKWLRAMVEHEIHHRGQLYIYLSILGVSTPPLFGLTSEQVADRSVG